LLVNKYPKEIDRILNKFPPERKRAAALPLLYLAQREYGHVSKEAIREVAGILDVDPTQVGGLVGFYTLLHAKPGGKYRIKFVPICLVHYAARKNSPRSYAKTCGLKWAKRLMMV